MIRLGDINITAMNLSRIQGTTSKVYVKDNKCFKIFNGLYQSERRSMLDKLIDIEDTKVDGIIYPKDLIFDKGELVGYTMDYFPYAINLYDYFTKDRFVNIHDIFSATKKASEILKEAHKKGIILQDFSFDNILIDGSSNVMICDIDGCSFEDNKGPFISMVTHNYYETHMRQRPVINENLDNQSLLLSMLLTIYHKMIYDIKFDGHNALFTNSQTLQNLNDTIQSLLKCSRTKIPYLDEVIDDNDRFIIDRSKQVSFIKKIKKDYRII